MNVVWEYLYPEDQTDFLCRASKHHVSNIGDINYDFIINVLDIMSIINIIMINAEYEYMGDMNYDDVLDILDIVEIINIIIDN